MRQLPGPPAIKWLRTLRLFKLIFRPLDYFDDDRKRYGDIYQLGGLTSPPFVIVSNPQAIEEIFTASPDSFEVGRGNASLSFLLGDNSLLLLDGEPHRQKRRLLMPAFHGECLQSYSQSICEITEQVTGRTSPALEGRGQPLTNQWLVGKSFPVRLYMQEITLRVILQAVFGLNRRQERYEQLRRLLSSLLDTISSPLSSSLIFFEALQQDWGSLSPWGRFLRLKQRVRQLLYEEIKERREQDKQTGNDILSVLMSAKDASGKPMSDEELHDELMTLLVAGHETTASALVWALYWIHYLPEVRDKLLGELETLGEEKNWHQIARLPYLEAVVAETLRIYPIVVGTFARRLKSPMELMGYKFETGTAFAASIYLTHQREDLYPSPKQFRPERFWERQYSPYEYLPFGGGNRRCLGAALAQMEMKLVLATILSRYELALKHNRPLKPVRRGLTIAPPSSFQMVVTKHKSPTKEV
ncbi:cytochrome P450 [Pleurocapsales cyanobacterium LEGE 06147]|nr:cytochrome P450 [Pleurocapsales cyanobacterium LEGE 06147]